MRVAVAGSCSSSFRIRMVSILTITFSACVAGNRFATGPASKRREASDVDPVFPDAGQADCPRDLFFDALVGGRAGRFCGVIVSRCVAGWEGVCESMIEDDERIRWAEVNVRNARRNTLIARINVIVAAILFCWCVYMMVSR